jgi:SM-20-related protein
MPEPAPFVAGEIPLFRINPSLDRRALAERFAERRRVQVRDVLTPETAATVRRVLERETPWGLAVQAGPEPQSLSPEELRALSPERRSGLLKGIAARLAAGDYGFVYQRYPMVTAYRERWDPDGPLALLLEHINDAPMLELVREVTGMPDLVKADAQATLFAPGQFLGLHDDGHVERGWRVAYVLNFADRWHPDWGGYLNFFDAEGDIVEGLAPRFNALNLFAVPQRHHVSFVPQWSPATRLAITGWFQVD